MNLKKIFLFILVGLMSFTLIACNEQNKVNPVDENPTEEPGDGEPGEGEPGEGEPGENPDDDIDYGDVTISDLTLYVNANRMSTYAVINPVFTKTELKEDLTYEVVEGDTRALIFSEEFVTARQLETKKVKVKAHSEHFETFFFVDVIYHNYNDPDFELYNKFNTQRFDVNGRRMYLKDILTSEHTLVVGDSFTATGFIGNYMKTFSEDKLILNAGIGSTTSYHWEAAFSHIIGTAPKNIVINIGTNNFYDLNDTVNESVASIQRLFSYIHAKFPETKIYYWAISPRNDTRFQSQVNEANAKLKLHIETLDYVTFVDAKLNSSDVYDGIHPNTQGYDKMFAALLASGIEITPKP